MNEKWGGHVGPSSYITSQMNYWDLGNTLKPEMNLNNILNSSSLHLEA
jgi:hypothetical protein